MRFSQLSSDIPLLLLLLDVRWERVCPAKSRVNDGKVRPARPTISPFSRPYLAMSVRYQAQPFRQRPRDPRERPTKSHSVGLPSPYNAPAGSSSAPSASTARTPRPSSSLAHAPVGPSPYDYLPTGRPAPNSVSSSVSTTPAPGQSSRGWYQVDPRRPLSPDELTEVNTISARPVATIHDLSDKLLRRMIAFYDVYDDEMGTVSSIFERAGLLKDFGWVCSRWRVSVPQLSTSLCLSATHALPLTSADVSKLNSL